jgi:hypothetical protein
VLPVKARTAPRWPFLPYLALPFRWQLAYATLTNKLKIMPAFARH